MAGLAQDTIGLDSVVACTLSSMTGVPDPQMRCLSRPAVPVINTSWFSSSALVSISRVLCGSRRPPLTPHAGRGEFPSFPCPRRFKRMFTSGTAEEKSKQMVDRCERSQEGESCLEMFLAVSVSGLPKNTAQASAGSGGRLTQPEASSALPTWCPRKAGFFTRWLNYN